MSIYKTQCRTDSAAARILNPRNPCDKDLSTMPGLCGSSRDLRWGSNITTDLFTFDFRHLSNLGKANTAAFCTARPWPHIVIDDFLPPDVAEKIVELFPAPDHSVWPDWRKRAPEQQLKKQGLGNVSRPLRMPAYLHHVMAIFQSSPFLNFLEELTGVKKLLPDPHLHGGGLHQILGGGFLNVHTDSTYLPRLDLYRRLNVLLYLNKDWHDRYNGNFELWDPDTMRCTKSVPPLFNRLVVFVTDKNSYHGHPAPLETPPGVTRKSMAFYYYTARPAENTHYDSKVDWHETQAT